MKLARRRLVGYEHLAEDVVSLALIKWSTITPAKPHLARIEQIIKSEAYSMIRSEQRRRDRETRVVHDRSAVVSSVETDNALAVLRQALVSTAKRTGIRVTASDTEILQLLFGGCSPAEVSRITGLSRAEIRKSRRMWALLANQVQLDSSVPADTKPQGTLQTHSSKASGGASPDEKASTIKDALPADPHSILDSEQQFVIKACEGGQTESAVAAEMTEVFGRPYNRDRVHRIKRTANKKLDRWQKLSTPDDRPGT